MVAVYNTDVSTIRAPAYEKDKRAKLYSRVPKMWFYYHTIKFQVFHMHFLYLLSYILENVDFWNQFQIRPMMGTSDV